MKQRRTSFFNNGSWLVAFIAIASIFASGLTVWIYSSHVFSTRDAHIISSDGAVEAFFPARDVGKIFPHQKARVSFEEEDLPPCKAEVVSTAIVSQGAKNLLFVTLKADAGRAMPSGSRCFLTIDTTIPLQNNEQRNED